MQEIESIIQKGIKILQDSIVCKDLHIKPRMECELLLSHILQTSRIHLHTHSNLTLSPKQEQDFFCLISRRSKAEPLEYLTNKASFYSSDFFVDSNVLIPRPETELLVEKCFEIIKLNNLRFIADIGTGSGIIAITLALLNKNLQIIATDISQNALDIAKKNVENFGVANRIKFIQSDLLQGLYGNDLANLEMIISNPPYIKNSYKITQNLTYEPQIALFGGENGSEVLQTLMQSVCQLKNNHKLQNLAFLCCEIGYDQRGILQDFAKNFKEIKSLDFYKDLSDFTRYFIAQIDS